ncbi:hypothetical protein TNCV_2853021 [Trichonephila clavipes]|uniref:Uncharacterized protein n=1 Tax=Trichonephila clavipes TaxID=2585209 RepID=A0A8X6RAL7_TRICX|nr:hypothetical protein TNCV_2853021 [Trichonephila clavipes]
MHQVFIKTFKLTIQDDQLHFSMKLCDRTTNTVLDIRNAEVHEQMFRSGGLSEARDPQCLSPQTSLVLIYRHTAFGMKG